VLEPYRRCGIATQMLEYILDLMKTDEEFKELLTRVGLIKTKQLKKEYATMPDLFSGTFSTLYGPLVPRPSVPSA
jgi:hypothetical protein